MAKKTYRTYHLKGLQILAHDERGNTIEINFRGGIQVDSTAKFSTSDERLQKALENSSSFNRDFYLESVRNDTPAPAKAEAENAPADGGEATGTDIETVQVANKADAIEWLKEHYSEKGYTASKLRTQTALDAACAACNVKFIFNS